MLCFIDPARSQKPTKGSIWRGPLQHPPIARANIVETLYELDIGEMGVLHFGVEPRHPLKFEIPQGCKGAEDSDAGWSDDFVLVHPGLG